MIVLVSDKLRGMPWYDPKQTGSSFHALSITGSPILQVQMLVDNLIVDGNAAKCAEALAIYVADNK